MLETGEVDAAVLDVNLGGELVYPVAETLARRGVPFIFVTGYGAESIDARFARVPVLQKPIERDMLAQVVSRHHNGSIRVAGAEPLGSGYTRVAAERY
jgi:two-component SAPR family response regulator